MPKFSNSVYFTETAKLAYQKSIISEIILELKTNFKGMPNLIEQLEALSYLLFLKSLNNYEEFKDLSLHMAFSGKIGTGKTTIAKKIAQILRDLNYLTKGHLISVTREDLVGEYIGHTAPKTRDILKQAQGGVLFIDNAYSLYKKNNKRDYGLDSIEAILQIMENKREDLVIILSDEEKNLLSLFEANPGISSRIGNHFYFDDYSNENLIQVLHFLLEKEGGFFLEKNCLPIINFYLNDFANFPTFANIRTVELFVHKILSYHIKNIFLGDSEENILTSNFLQIKETNILKICSKDFLALVGKDH